LVWTAAQERERSTWTVDESGSVVDRVDGVRVGVAGEVWRWKEVPGAVRTHACPDIDENGNALPVGPEPPPGTSLRVSLEEVDGRASEQVVVAAIANDSEARDIEQSAELVATVGPFAFVRTQLYVYACGAHGGVAAGFRVWDIGRGAVAWDDSSTGSDVAWTTDAPESDALAELAAQEDVSTFADEHGRIATELTAILPVFAHEARLTLAFQFTAASCYACSDGLWSSYTKSARTPARAIPGPLRPWVDPPASVRAFALAHPDLNVRGWSVRSGSEP
jgi:hypothetical protein